MFLHPISLLSLIVLLASPLLQASSLPAINPPTEPKLISNTPYNRVEAKDSKAKIEVVRPSTPLIESNASYFCDIESDPPPSSLKYGTRSTSCYSPLARQAMTSAYAAPPKVAEQDAADSASPSTTSNILP